MKRLWCVAMLAASACGGAAESAPSQSPSGTTPSAVPESAGAHNAAAPPSMPSARAEVDRAEQQIAAAQSDCTEACRALASMERAAEHLCALDSGAECARVRQRIEAARERVRTSCGECSR